MKNKQILEIKLSKNSDINEEDIPSNIDEVIFHITENSSVLLRVKPRKTALKYTIFGCFESEFSLFLDDKASEINRDFNIKNALTLNVAFADFSFLNRKVNLTFNLLEEGAKINFKKSVLASKNVDKYFSINVNHLKEKTYSSIESYGVVVDASRLTFTGNSKIADNIPKCEAHQKNKIIVFDESAVAKANPKLLIHNNNVVASHAAAVGKLNDEILFYLASRGISEEEAKKLLTKGYLLPVVKLYKQEKEQEMLLKQLDGVI